MELRHHAWELKQMQSLPLDAKIRMSKMRIQQWYLAFDGMVYVSFSGGKDSTVLLHLVRSMFPDVEGVFCDTGLEYPEVRQFVKKQENITIIRPEMNFRQVIMKYGYPIATKEVARKIQYAKAGSEWAQKFIDGSAVDAEGKPSRYRVPEKWLKLLNAPFDVSAYCCDVMKKKQGRNFLLELWLVNQRLGNKHGCVQDAMHLKERNQSLHQCLFGQKMMFFNT